MSEIKTRKKTFRASCLMKAGASAAYTAGNIMNLAPICLGAVVTGSTTVTPASVVGIRNGMTVTAALGLTANYTVSNLNTSAGTFSVSSAATATSAATTLTFTANDLPKFDLSAFASPCDMVDITNVKIVSSAGGATIKLAPVLMFFDTSAVQTTVSNNTAFTPSFSVMADNCQARIVMDSAATTFTNVGASAYETQKADIVRPAKLDSKACLHMVAMDTNTYLFSSTETVQFTITGIVK